jgi:N-acetylmuramoyl-L-alanine amidase
MGFACPSMMNAGWMSGKPLWNGQSGPARAGCEIPCLCARLSHNQAVSGRAAMFALLLVIPAGCSTTPRARDGAAEVAVVPDPEMATAPEPPNIPATNLPVQVPAQPAAHNPANPEHFAFTGTWIPLERWSLSNGFGALRRVADVTPSYWFTASNGTMGIRVGSQSASWNGLEYRLGFAPQLVDGRPFVHALDVRKNFLPLLDNPLRMKTGPVIVIDAGHGGSDVGTSNVFSGHFEKEYTLDWARRLQALLATNGWTVWLTRTGDFAVPLSNRVAFAELHKADLFLSLHFNSSYPDRQQSGLETYCLTPAGMPSNLTRGYKDDLWAVYPNNYFDEENLQFAIELHRALLDVNGHADRGVRRARFPAVLQGQNRPAVLVEGGYLSNPKEARLIADSAYRQKLAGAIAQALMNSSGGGVTRLVSQAPAAPSADPPGVKNR